MNVNVWTNRVIRWGFYLLVILVPLILTPWNFELFEYNKMMLTYGITVVILAAWLVKMIDARELRKSYFGATVYALIWRCRQESYLKILYLKAVKFLKNLRTPETYANHPEVTLYRKLGKGGWPFGCSRGTFFC